jgi:hypothetical protein
MSHEPVKDEDRLHWEMSNRDFLVIPWCSELNQEQQTPE